MITTSDSSIFRNNKEKVKKKKEKNFVVIPLGFIYFTNFIYIHIYIDYISSNYNHVRVLIYLKTKYLYFQTCFFQFSLLLSSSGNHSLISFFCEYGDYFCLIDWILGSMSEII